MPARSAAAPAGRRATSCSRTAARHTLAACAPCYLKSHSQGEYVFDHAWADAYERAGGRYYPKLQIAVPFTPVPGPAAAGAAAGPMPRPSEALLAAAAVELASATALRACTSPSSRRPSGSGWATSGFLQRTDQQFHWSNAGYATFDDFLASLASRKRKAVRKERAQALERRASTIDWLAGATSPRRTGTPSSPSTWTPARASGAGPISTASSSRCSARRMADRCLLVLAKRGGAADRRRADLIGGDCLYGRYWGAVEHHPCLHFELCYYQAIEFAIAAQARARRGRRAGRAQAGARLPADQHLLGALHRRSRRCAAPSPTISSASAPTWMPPARSSPNTHPSAKVRLSNRT